MAPSYPTASILSVLTSSPTPPSLPSITRNGTPGSSSPSSPRPSSSPISRSSQPSAGTSTGVDPYIASSLTAGVSRPYQPLVDPVAAGILNQSGYVPAKHSSPLHWQTGHGGSGNGNRSFQGQNANNYHYVNDSSASSPLTRSDTASSSTSFSNHNTNGGDSTSSSPQPRVPSRSGSTKSRFRLSVSSLTKRRSLPPVPQNQLKLDQSEPPPPLPTSPISPPPQSPSSPVPWAFSQLPRTGNPVASTGTLPPAPPLGQQVQPQPPPSSVATQPQRRPQPQPPLLQTPTQGSAIAPEYHQSPGPISPTSSLAPSTPTTPTPTPLTSPSTSNKPMEVANSYLEQITQRAASPTKSQATGSGCPRRMPTFGKTSSSSGGSGSGTSLKSPTSSNTRPLPSPTPGPTRALPPAPGPNSPTSTRGEEDSDSSSISVTSIGDSPHQYQTKLLKTNPYQHQLEVFIPNTYSMSSNSSQSHSAGGNGGGGGLASPIAGPSSPSPSSKFSPSLPPLSTPTSPQARTGRMSQATTLVSSPLSARPKSRSGSLSNPNSFSPPLLPSANLPPPPVSSDLSGEVVALKTEMRLLRDYVVRLEGGFHDLAKEVKELRLQQASGAVGLAGNGPMNRNGSKDWNTPNNNTNTNGRHHSGSASSYSNHESNKSSSSSSHRISSLSGSLAEFAAKPKPDLVVNIAGRVGTLTIRLFDEEAPHGTNFLRETIIPALSVSSQFRSEVRSRPSFSFCFINLPEAHRLIGTFRRTLAETHGYRQRAGTGTQEDRWKGRKFLVSVAMETLPDKLTQEWADQIVLRVHNAPIRSSDFQSTIVVGEVIPDNTSALKDSISLSPLDRLEGVGFVSFAKPLVEPTSGFESESDDLDDNNNDTLVKKSSHRSKEKEEKRKSLKDKDKDKKWKNATIWL